MSLVKNIYTTLIRKKTLNDTSVSKMAKVLTTLDLTALGIGATLGVGIYVLAGEVSKHIAGPAVIISFMIAAVASVFAGLCYAEFGARVPKAGSAYIYSYVTIGELMAFFIGWNLILEYAIGGASVVKGLSTYVDKLMDNVMQNFFREHMPMPGGAVAEYPDFFALGVTVIFAIGIAIGAKESSVVNTIFTMSNLTVVLYVVITGSFKADPINWQLTEVEPGYGNGGFAPYGVSGIIRGAAICFYGFIGFDCIATAGEEAKNPKKSIPISIIISLSIIFVAYFSVSTVLTMMIPYYAQDEEAPLPHVFAYYDWTVAQYIVSFGAIFGLCSSLMGSMFPLPRVIYAMAKDGLIFAFMGKIHPRFKTPFYGTLLAGTLSGCIAAIFNLSQLVNMMSIGTLLAYSMVAACVLLLRFEVDDTTVVADDDNKQKITYEIFLKQLFNLNKLKYPTKLTSGIVTGCVVLYWACCFALSAVIRVWGEEITNIVWYPIFLLVLFICLPIILLVIVKQQPRSSRELSFSVPLVPWLPSLSILINIYLMVQLDELTWIRFLVWIIIGLLIYFAYGIRHSKERPEYKALESQTVEKGEATTNVSGADINNSTDELIKKE